MSYKLDGEEMVKKLAQITYKANIPCCELADRILKEFKEEIVGTKYQIMFILMNAWSELNQLKDAPNSGGIQPGCSNPSFGELVMIDQFNPEEGDNESNAIMSSKKCELNAQQIDRNQMEQKTEKQGPAVGRVEQNKNLAETRDLSIFVKKDPDICVEMAPDNCIGRTPEDDDEIIIERVIENGRDVTKNPPPPKESFSDQSWRQPP